MESLWISPCTPVSHSVPRDPPGGRSPGSVFRSEPLRLRLDAGSGANENSPMTAYVPRLPFSLDPLMAEAKRRMRKRRVLILVSAVVIGGGAAGTTLALSQSSGFRAAAPCPGATSYVYAVPSYPTKPPPAPAWPPPQGSYWGWMPRSHALQVGNWVRVDTGGLWRITAIGALPNDCQFMTFVGGIGRRLVGGSVSGSLTLQPVR